MSQPIRVFLLDDHEVVRRGLRELLGAEDDIRVVGEAATAGRALLDMDRDPPGRGRPGRAPARQ